jgi:gamma-glutamyl-gamma-aminobutyrate hydrolase PuuD
MSPPVKTKRQANFKDFKRLLAFKGLVEQKNVFNSLLVRASIGLFWHPNLHKNSSNKLLEIFSYLMAETKY